MVLLVALKQHGNHGSTPRDWPLQRKWKSQRKDLKIPWANKEVILQIYCSKQVETRICSSVGEVCWFTQGGASTEHNAWQNWFSAALSVVIQYTDQSHLKAETTVSDLPDSSPLLAVLKCLKDNVKCGRFHNAFLQWFSEKQKKGMTFSYGFTALESKYFCWHFATFIQELLKISSLSKGSVKKLYTLAFVAVKFRDAVSIYSRVEVRIEQVVKLKTSCQHFFYANCLLLNVVTSTVRTVGRVTLITVTSYIWGLAMDWASIQCRVERQSMLSWLSM